MSDLKQEQEIIDKNDEICELIEDDDENNIKYGNGGIAGRTVTLQMLLAAKMLTPGKSTMTIEYLGQKFIGDLLPDGKIKSQETETIFCSPSAWAMYCKRIINPDKKSGCGWASVKYKGKKLDAYKQSWLKKCQTQKDTTASDEDCESESVATEKKEMTPPPPPVKRTVLSHNTIANRNIPHDANSIVEAVPFSNLGKMQPFLVSITKSALFLIDFHCHLAKSEVCGYLGGSWDVNAHNLIVTHVYPCRNTRHDREKAGEVEMAIQREMMKQNLTLVGWYHSHPKNPAQPTLRDCDTQLDYQIKLKGPSDTSYSPCIGFICSPYNEEIESPESTIVAYWVVPPPENKPMEYGRPMLMTYTISPDPQNNVTPALKTEMQLLIDYYKQFDKVLLQFSENYREDMTFIEKLKSSLFSKFPKEETDDKFWNFIRELLELEAEEKFVRPACAPEEVKPEIVDLEQDKKSDDSGSTDRQQDKKSNIDKTPSLLSITSLQQQLSLPSGLNMNPTTLGSGIVIPSISNNFSTNSTTSSSPRDSPITISSNAASPGKFEIPIRASPSPAKSDTSSTKTRNSPAPSPSKFGDLPLRNNSPSVMPNPNIYDLSGANTGMTPESMNEFLTASLASLSAKLPPGMQPSELAVLFQQKLAEYGITGFNPSAAAAAISSSSKANATPPPPIPPPQTTSTPSHSSSTKTHGSYKDLYKDLDKYDLNYLLQAQYGLSGLPMPKSSGKSSTGSSKSERDRDRHSSMSSSKRNNYESLASISSSHGGSNISNLMSFSNSKMPQMIDLEDPKSELSKLSDFMKSPEYASLLLQHAAGYGSPANYGLGSEISISKKSSKKSSSASSSSNYQQSDLSSLLQQPSKLTDFSSPLSSKKPFDYSSLLEQHKLPDLTSITPISSANDSSMSGVPDLSALFGPVLGGKKMEQTTSSQNDMLNSLFQNVSRTPDLSSLLLAQSGGKASDLSSYFASPSSSTSSKSGLDQSPSLLPTISPLKVQEISSLFQHSKYPGIPDPLAKSTLAANNMYMTPTASLLKMQQEAINAMMMKPPKATTPLSTLSSSSGGSVVRNSETPPERPTSKSSSSNRDSPHIIPPTNLKYNFSAADLAVSSIPMSAQSSQLPTDFSRKTPVTPPVDMSSALLNVEQSLQPQPPPKKRMEFSSIADLAGGAPPSKITKLDDDDNGGVLNLSNND